jgi:DNA recombination-dependent growth factor C
VGLVVYINVSSFFLRFVNQLFSKTVLLVTHAQPAHSIVTHVRLAMGRHPVVSTTAQHALSIAMHAQRATRVTAEHLVVSKTVRLAPSTATHVRLAMAQHLVASKTVRLAPSTATHVRLAMTVHHALSIVMLDQLASSKTVRHALSIAQTHADHASLMTAHASLTATTATTAPTVVQTALTA